MFPYKVKILSPPAYPFRETEVYLAWPRRHPKFNLHHLRKISARSKMAVLTPKSFQHEPNKGLPVQIQQLEQSLKYVHS